MSQELLGEPEFARGEVHATAVHGRLAGEDVERDSAVGEDDRRRRGALTQARTHPCEEFGDGEGLGDVVAGARVQAFDRVVRPASSREHDDRYVVAIGTHVAEYVEPVDRGDADVKHDEVDVGVRQHIQRELAVIGGDDLVALAAQSTLHERDDVGFVIHHEYPGHPVASRCITTSPARTGVGIAIPVPVEISNVNVAPPPGVSATAQWPP